MLTVDRSKEVIESCRKLIKIKSYSGHEECLALELKNVMTDFSFDEVYIDEYGSVIGCIKGKKPGRKLLLDGHIDTVPVTDRHKWSFDPFGAEICNDRIYGRGASDMKGAVSAMLCAARYLGEDLGKEFSGEIYVAGTVHEECFEGVAARKISERVKPDVVIIGEASSLNLKRGQRGRAEIVLETFGRQAHSANPEKGINAVYHMSALIEQIKKLEYSRDDFLGNGILELTDIISSPYPGASVVPDYCRCTFDRRLLPGETRFDVLRPLCQLIAKLKSEDLLADAKVSFANGREKCHTGSYIEAERFFPAWMADEGDSHIQKALKALKAADIDVSLSHYAFCTNGSHYAGEAGIKTLGFGPSAESLAHIVDEYIEINQLLTACKGYYSIVKALLE